MNTSVVPNEEISNLLNSWYQSIISQHAIKATHLKEEIDKKIFNIEENQDILTYYSLIEFRYKLLVCDTEGYEEILDKIEPLPEQAEQFLKYYYHFFKAIYENSLANHREARIHYEQAEKLLNQVTNELEKAEFDYMLASFHYQTLNPLLAISYANRAYTIFSKNEGYEVKSAACLNTLGLSCTKLKQFESAEEHFISALDTFKKYNEEHLANKVRHNLGLLYADQNLSELAVKHLRESLKDNPKTLFLLAREYYKLGKNEIAAEIIEQGCKLNNLEEYKYHFNILKELNKKADVKEIEKAIIAGIYYFKEEELWGHVKEYASMLGNTFYELNNHETSSKYLHMALTADKKDMEKGALK
ncbi:Rap family tetratricopeptide repeat protein [Bacillus cereus group sp. BfR-BA-01380]|uniref:Rap family tetratricopeptide repeat protein n=1 Tax=Bacillus cereus group sp. BfR-BA-01380 TaxID=2920324 RepID=UPI001F593377|nr:Rap family tetratricopeptide repeat protein [Bacillus cereus group sp. BfR-BA-01380]